MNNVAIRVESLSKQYRLGQREPYRSLRDVLARTAAAPFRRLNAVLQPVCPAMERGMIWALKDMSFEVQQGEVVGIIGRNGAGKSTLLKILSRITKPTLGFAEIHGRVGSLLEVGTGFHPELTGRENIYLNGAILGMKRKEIDRNFGEIVDFAEIGKFLDTPVKRYSSGMYMRLAFSVAAHLEPEILLVDEVLAVGDAAFQKKCLGKMGQVAQQGRTVLFVSHNMDAIRKLCKRGIVLSSGNMLVDSEIETALGIYLNESISLLNPSIELPERAMNTYEENLGRGNRLSFYSMDGQQKAEFRLWEHWKIVLEFEIFKPLQHVIAAIGISTVQGTPVVTYWTEPQALAPGSYLAEFICDVPFKASDLSVGVGLSELERAFYYLQNLGHVTINEVSTREQPFKASGAGLLLSSTSSKIVKAR